MDGQRKKVLLVGGGTGGHIIPVFEVYKKLKQSNSQLSILVVGSGSSIEKQFFGPIKNYRTIRSGKLRRHLTIKNLSEIINFTIGLVQAFWLLNRERPTLIFSKGGYVSLPIITAAKFLRLPYFIHESDIEMGMTNKRAVSGAKKIFVSFPLNYYGRIDQNKFVYSGPIVRDEIKQSHQAGRAEFGFNDNDPVILVTGGSQGALPINKALAKALPLVLNRYNVIHLTGDHSFEWVNTFRDSLDTEKRSKYCVKSFLGLEGGVDKMLEAIDLADVVISRAGANTVSELAIKGKPMILVPWKHAAADHQQKNARLLEEANSAIVITDDELNSAKLIESISLLFSAGGKKMHELSKNTKEIFPADGLERVCEEILKFMKK